MATGTTATTGPGRKLVLGTVISDKRQKTITVEVRRLVKHPRYGKYVYRSTLFHAHDEKGEAKRGDRVEILETRPLSKQKRFRLARIVERAAQLGGLEIKEVEVTPAKQAAPSAPAAAQGEGAGEAKG